MYPDYPLVIKKRGRAGGTRVLAPGDWFVDRSTAPGEDADFYEVKPHGGRRLIAVSDIVREERTP
jgi:hypothetical protein